jgi:Holliday junction resolvase
MTRHRSDNNQAEIVAALREAHVDVTITSSLGKGFPDIVAGHGGVNYFMEIKGKKEPLTLAEEAWHSMWRGHKAVVRTVEEALAVVHQKGNLKKPIK